MLTEREIESELRELHHIYINKSQRIDDLDDSVVSLAGDDAISQYMISSFSRRIRFLLHQYLLLKKKKLPEELSNKPEPTSQPKSRLRAAFDIGKKFIDIIDDIWSALRNTSIPKHIIDMLNPFLVSASGGIINVVEAIFGLKRAYKAYKNKNIGQRKLRIATGVGAFALGITGTVCAGLLIASGVGAAIAGAAFMPIIIPSTLLGVYSLKLLRKTYTLHRAKQEEAKAKAAYYKVVMEWDNELNNFRQQGLALQSELKKAEKAVLEILNKKNVSTEDQEKLDSYQHYLALQEKLDAGYQEVQSRLESARLRYEHCHQETLKAERKVALSMLEAAASGLVLAGTILGLAAILGAASVASFGVLPLALVVTGVVLGVLVKVFEKVDNKTANKLSGSIRNFFSRLFSRKPKTITEEQQPLLNLEKPQVAPTRHYGTTARAVAALQAAAVPTPFPAPASNRAGVLALVPQQHKPIAAIGQQVVEVGAIASVVVRPSLFATNKLPYPVRLTECPDGVRRLIPEGAQRRHLYNLSS